MRLVVLGATGNLGTALLGQVARSHPDWHVIGVARRPPSSAQPPVTGRPAPPAAQWVALDVTQPDAVGRLADVCDGADAVVNFVWAVQPTHDRTHLRWVNVGGAAGVLEAVATAEVPHLIHTSSVAAYRPSPHKPVVDENAPIGALPSSAYAQDKVAVEDMLDAYGTGRFLARRRARPDTVVTRLRPALVMHDDAAAEVSRYFLGRLSAGLPLLSRLSPPVVPVPRSLLVPIIAAEDVADAVVRIVERRAGGAFNLSADEPVDAAMFAAAVAARPVPVPNAVVRGLVSLSWHARVQPTDPGWVDLARNAPLLDTTRARTELDWQPRHRAADALASFLRAMTEGRGGPTPVLAPHTASGGPAETAPVGTAPSD